MKKGHRNYKRTSDICFSDIVGAVLMRRADLRDFNDQLNGKFHIQNPNDPDGYGMCIYSQKEYLDKITSKSSAMAFGKGVVKIHEVCHACATAYRNSKKENTMVVFQGKGVINLNGQDYVKVESAKFQIERLNDEVVHLHSELSKAKKTISDLSFPEIEGELRTIQSVEHIEYLVSVPMSANVPKTIMRTKITLKKTNVHYKAGQKVRIIIED